MASSKLQNNPYLSHLPPHQKGASRSNPSAKDPLYGFIPRRVKGNQARKVMERDLNPFTKQPYSGRYKALLNSRKELPVFGRMDEFFKIFNENQIMIVVGETGAGKSTQIPQFVAFSDLPHTRRKMVACVQPRRLAAMSLATRVADEMDVHLGEHVGYSIRFEEMIDPDTTFLKYMTGGMLLREAQNDPTLERYSTIILDEVHERSLDTDILMGILKGIAKKRKDLKIIVMSATMNVTKFRKYFNLRSDEQVSLLKVPGRTHPVEVFYTQEPEPDYLEAAIRTTMMIHRSEAPGDILLFLTGEQEIEDACRKIKLEVKDAIKQHPGSVGPIVCIPLYSSLSPQKQQSIFDSPPVAIKGGPSGRKVVVATNIAETSITIDGIVYVVDPGVSKQKVYNPQIRVESLVVSSISKASAQQRAGRAGRLRPGKCFRLYTEREFHREMEEYDHPEILRSNLSTTVLTLLKIGIKDLVTFDFVDPPAPELLLRALKLLNYLAAVDDDGNLTPLGAMMAEFPVEPQLAKLLIVSPKFRCSNEILTITAMMSAPNIWICPPGARQRQGADAAKKHLAVHDGDHLTLLEVYNQYYLNLHDKNWAWNNYLSAQSLKEAEMIRKQLKGVMERFYIELNSLSDEKKLFTNVRQALVCGFLMQIAHKEKDGNYLTLKDNQVVALHPSCDLITQPEWVVYNEFVLSSRPYIRTVSEVKAEWLIEFGGKYFDLVSFPDGETKSALQRAWNKRMGTTESASDRTSKPSKRKDKGPSGGIQKKKANRRR